MKARAFSEHITSRICAPFHVHTGLKIPVGFLKYSTGILPAGAEWPAPSLVSS
jgi:hypothetical protein